MSESSNHSFILNILNRLPQLTFDQTCLSTLLKKKINTLKQKT